MKLEFNGDLDADKALAQWKEILGGLMARTKEQAKTKAGRDQIRAEFGCGLEGYEEEDRQFYSNNPQYAFGIREAFGPHP